jgi:hypothetical protein
LVLAGALLSGCGGGKTISTPEGTVTITEQGDTTEVSIEAQGEEGKIEIRADQQSGTVTTEEGEVAFELNRDLAEEEIGIPFYPGAEVAQTAAWRRDGGPEGELKHATFTTTDSVDEVKAFYEEKFADARTALDMSSEDGRVVQMLLEQGDTQKVVMISRDKGAGETMIVLQSGQFGE